MALEPNMGAKNAKRTLQQYKKASVAKPLSRFILHVQMKIDIYYVSIFINLFKLCFSVLLYLSLCHLQATADLQTQIDKKRTKDYEKGLRLQHIKM